MRIRVLPQTLINQIAAGEVVVNMAAAVKELVENALDAGARHIDLEVGTGLRDLVITDDGHGMSRDDAELCLQRHATSKIRTPEDLFALSTRGFRGEALPSIASVSRLEIRTRTPDDVAGTRVVVDGGVIESIEPIGCPVGTRIAVRDLFFNVPARRNFLKGAAAELNALLHTVTRQALAAPDVGFRVVREGESLLELPAKQGLAARFADVAGSRLRGDLLELAFERDGVRITGLLAHPASARGDRRAQYLFVNGRPFANRSAAAAIEQACRGFLMVGRFPMFAVFIALPPDAVDINVHPSKEEVRFRNERNVSGACYHAARNALEAHGFVPTMQIEGESSGAPRPGDDLAGLPLPSTPQELLDRAFERKRATQHDMLLQAESQLAAQPVAHEFAPAIDRGAPAPTSDPARPVRVVRAPVAAAPGEKPERDFWDRPYDPEPLGQVANTFIVARYGDDLLLIDQHAAHERLRFLEITRSGIDGASQTLLVPILLEIAPDRVGALEALLPSLNSLGFALEPFGGRTWALGAVPADLVKLDMANIVLDLLDEYETNPTLSRIDDLRDQIAVRAACHSSIRGGDRLTMPEMEELLRQMRACRLSFTCPHGRPTILRLGKEELEKRFGRMG